jgi:vacuolar-type H+-ATPase subunit H
MGPSEAIAAGEVHSGTGGHDAPHEALGLLEHAGKVAEETLNNARAEAEQLITAARAEAAALRQSAQEDAKRQRERADRDAEQRRLEAVGEAERLVGHARQEVTRLEQQAVRLRSERDATAETARALASRLARAAEGQDPLETDKGRPAD